KMDLELKIFGSGFISKVLFSYDLLNKLSILNVNPKPPNPINMKNHLFPALCNVILLVAFSFPGFAQSQKATAYKDWNYSQSNVFGLIPLESTTQRRYYKITKVDNQSTKVQEYDPSGIV